ncbi:hypothetical protein [Paraburkholderia sp. HD33-4]|uniref:hypothetical protein n=1 Tax=Paraburkholderia sp. HD33-4 TaxID=2883242 RepID=UPI001F308F64|nr:hypothetical protein [Paraburkholderia sp. HD33-4]
MSADRITETLVLEAVRIIEQREADAHLDRVIQMLFEGGEREPLDALVVMLGLTRALRSPEGRKMLGASRKGRRKEARFESVQYFRGGAVFEVVRCFSEGELTRAAAREALAEHVGDANIKTLNALLDSLCRHFNLPPPA